MQLAAIEFAKNVCRIKNPESREFYKNTNGRDLNFVIDLMPEQQSLVNKGGSMRLGSYPCVVVKKSKTHSIYKKPLIEERHRHRYEFNSRFLDEFKQHGMQVAGFCKGKEHLVEIIEIPKHPWFIGVQFHPEFQSKPTAPHPLFVSFIETCNRRM